MINAEGSTRQNVAKEGRDVKDVNRSVQKKIEAPTCYCCNLVHQTCCAGAHVQIDFGLIQC